MTDAISEARKPPQVEWHDVPYGGLAREAMDEISRLRTQLSEVERERDAAVLAEREACAKIADAHASTTVIGWPPNENAASQVRSGEIAAAIRSRTAPPVTDNGVYASSVKTSQAIEGVKS